MRNDEKVILDLCGGTGSWSRPYSEAGYTVILVTLPFFDVRYFEPPEGVYGILAAPPCTHFSSSGARWWKSFDLQGLTQQSLEIVHACLYIIGETNPRGFWCLENPVGRLAKLIPELGHWNHRFDPYDYGDPYTKATCLWGNFNMPSKTPVAPEYVYSKRGRRFSKIAWMSSKDNRGSVRAVTPAGFSKAFFLANQ